MLLIYKAAETVKQETDESDQKQGSYEQKTLNYAGKGKCVLFFQQFQSRELKLYW